LVQNVYEMGSIIKPLTIAAGLDAGVITAKTTYNDEGSMTFNNKTIYNYDKRGRGVVDMQEVLNQSLNTGVAMLFKNLAIKSSLIIC
jgi:cell division protein FtsI/penicillin-binding protein 2